nr:hypothetical protein [Tanacetum cinerariifolium]
MSEPMTSQSAFSFPDPTSSSTQQATFTSFSPRQTYITSEPVTNSQPNPQTSNNFQNRQFQQYHTATLSSNNAKFPYLKKEEYETWAMKMEYWIMNTDHNLWKIIQNEGLSFFLLSHLRNIEIWLAVKARFGGNEESKKIRKTMLKQEFSEFSMSKEEGLHKGYDRFQKILSQLNQMQAKPDNDDVNMKFLRALPHSWSQVALTLKTRGGLEYLSFDDLYNKLRSLEIDVKENEPTQQLAYEDFEQVDQIEMEELDIKWQMAMLSLRTNRFQKKAERKINFNNKDPARFDRRKARCYNCLQLGHFARWCNVKKVDEKARYSAFKISEEFSEFSVSEEEGLHKGYDRECNVKKGDEKTRHFAFKISEGKQVYGLMAGFKSDFADHDVNVAGSVYDAAAEFAMMGISPKAKIEKKEWEVKLEESLA